jgi:hypothetical protein
MMNGRTAAYHSRFFILNPMCFFSKICMLSVHKLPQLMKGEALSWGFIIYRSSFIIRQYASNG